MAEPRGARVDDAIRTAITGTQQACPACGCRVRQPLYTSGPYRYVECPGCGLAHLDPLPAEVEARSNFDDSYFSGGVPGGYDDYVADEPLHRQNARLRLGMLDGLGSRPPGRLLDVGCAHGFFLDEARSAGWAAQGVEVSPEAAGSARRRFGLEVASDLGTVADVEPNAFDLVAFYQVLEHMASPLDALCHARRLVGPDGAVVVETWDRQSPIARLMGSHWQEVAPPSVVWLWDPHSIGLLLAEAGFGLGIVRRTKKRVSLRFVTSLLDGQGGPMGRVGRMMRNSPVRDRSFVYGLGDLITVVAFPNPAADPRS